MKTTILLFIVAIFSFTSAYILPIKEIYLGVYATPGFLALFGVLYQIFRDQSAHERNLELLRKQQIFNIGATSHMANTAFDKHVEFCEKYIQEVHATVVTLYKNGPTEKAHDHAGNFHILRQEYAAWLTNDINENLLPFEQALRSLGAGEYFINATNGESKYEEQRSEQVSKVYLEFKKILSVDVEEQPDPEIAVEAVKVKVRSILGIEDLVQLRKSLIREASSAINTEQ